MAISSPGPEPVPDDCQERASSVQRRDLGEAFAPAMAALFELGTELGDVLDGLLDEYAIARIERSIAGIDLVLAELLWLRSILANPVGRLELAGAAPDLAAALADRPGQSWTMP